MSKKRRSSPSRESSRKPRLQTRQTPDLADVLAAMQHKRYHIRQERDYDLNIVDIRSSEIRLNEFNDHLVVFFPFQGNWQVHTYQITTLPGYTYLAERLMNSKGTSILVPGQYRDKYTVRKHNNEYQALCQKRGVTVSVWRDDTLDGRINPDKSNVRTATGINIHKAAASGCAALVNSASAGCQVFRCAADFESFMAIVRASRDACGNSFTYTLFDEADA